MTFLLHVHHTSKFLLATLLLSAGACGWAQESEHQSDGDAPTSRDDIIRWVHDLDSDLFLNRELATEKLIAAGAASIDFVVRALATNNLEVTTRGVHILRELALDSDPETSDAARVALEKVAAPRVTSAARRATEALTRLNVVRHERALEELKRLGAMLGERQSRLGFQLIEKVSLEIGDKWHGERGDLARLRWLRNIDELVLSHPDIDDNALAYASEMTGLTTLTVRKLKITDRGIRSLRQHKTLETLNVLYSPIGDAAVESISAISGLTDLRMFGTGLTAEGKEQLVQALPGARVDVRRGAFLGIGCDPTRRGCVIQTVRPNTAAERAGLLIGDLIESYEGEEVEDFEELTAAIARNAPGDTVSLKIMRGDESLKKQLKLGGWERLD
jgi:hypothetical protein